MPDTAISKFGDLKTIDILERTAALKLDDATTQMVVAGSILDHLGWITNRFSYRQPLAPDDPDLAGRFAQTFEHDDWTDGESVVQADGDEGFNRRFHQVEADLASLGQEIGRAFGEVAALRKQLASMFEDIRAAFDRLDTRVVQQKPVPVQIDPRVRDPRIFDPRVLDPLILDPRIVDPVDPAVVKPTIPGIGPIIRPNRIFEVAGSPGEGIAFGKPARKLSRETFAGQPVDVWSTEAGMILVPVSKPAGDIGTHVAVDPGLGRIGAAASWIASNDAAIKDAVKDGPLAVDAVRKKFGGVVLEDGTTFGDLLDGVPADAVVRSPADLSALITDRQVKSIVDDGRMLDVVIGAVGLPPSDKAVSEVGLGSLKMLDEAQRAALGGAGISTVGQLAAVEPAKVMSLFTNAGIATDAGFAGKLVGIGRGLERFRQR